jgi:uncharacterized YigZ family protein
VLVPTGKSLEIIEIKKSRFISIAMYVSSAEEAREVVKVIKLEYSDSSHVVYAFLSGSNADIFGFSDDREPSGTAGRPVLEVVKGSGITNIIVLVVRYFGGTKLGTGGLVKAYTEAAKLSLKHLAVEELVAKTGFTLNLTYNLYDQIIKILKKNSAEITDLVFDTQIHISGIIPEKELSAADITIRDVSSGKIRLVTEK